jgi:phosphoglycerol geranylgeranyltransferase
MERRGEKGRKESSPDKGVFRRLESQMAEGPIHFTLIDPDKTPGKKAGTVAKEAESLGSFAILLGGSTGITPAAMGDAALSIHQSCHLPVIIFPQGAESLTREADGILFMSLLNSRNLGLVIRTQARSSLAVKALGLEPIPVGYLVIAPGMKVGEVGEADCVDRSDLEGACGYALAAQYFGMRLVYLEAGSGAPSPVPTEMIRAVKGAANIRVMVGGGIRTGEDAAKVLDGGADAIITGTVVEEDGGRALAPILSEVKRHRAR